MSEEVGEGVQKHHVNDLSKQEWPLSPYKERRDYRPKFHGGTGCDFKSPRVP